jgi:hypothetical protein
MFQANRNRHVAAALLLALGAPVAFAAETAATPRVTSQAPVVKVRPRVPQLSADVKARRERLWNAASPAVRAWVKQVAPGIAKGTGEPEALARAAVQARWSHVRAAGASDTLTFMANYEAAKALQVDIKNKLDSMSEMGEMDQMRTQAAMDRLSKLMSTLSNLLKKASETASGITQNMK